MTAPLALPDLPRWVEAHGIAADAASWRCELGAGFAVGSDRAKLIVIAGDADVEAASRLARDHAAHAILVAIERADLRVLGPGERAILHTLPDPDALPELDGAVQLPAGAPLDHLEPALAAELRATSVPIYAAYVDGVPVAFASAPWRSAAYFDISVDVVPGARQLGLGTLVAAAMIREERALGREAVWGADEGNHASLALARRLGFVAVDELWVIAPRA